MSAVSMRLTPASSAPSTASLLLGAQFTDPRDGTAVTLADPRITAGVLLAAPGRGGDALTAYTTEN